MNQTAKRLHIGYVDDSKKFRHGFRLAQDYLNSIGFHITSECVPTIEQLLTAYDYNEHVGPNTPPIQSIEQPNITLQAAHPPFDLLLTDYHIPTQYQAKYWGGTSTENGDKAFNKMKDEELAKALQARMRHIGGKGSFFAVPDSDAADPYWLANRPFVEMVTSQEYRVLAGEDDPDIIHFHDYSVPVDGWVVRDILGTTAIAALRTMEEASWVPLPPIVGFSGKQREWDVDFDVQKYSNGILISTLLPILELVKKGQLSPEILPPHLDYHAIAKEAIRQAAIMDSIPDDIIQEAGTKVEAAGRHPYGDVDWITKTMPKAATGKYTTTNGLPDTEAVIAALLEQPDIMVKQRKDRPAPLSAEAGAAALSTVSAPSAELQSVIVQTIPRLPGGSLL